jgi:hypothetical protein
MRILFSLVGLSLLAACGVETAGTAAVQAQARAREVEAAKQVEAQFRQQTEQGLADDARRLREAEDKAR